MVSLRELVETARSQGWASAHMPLATLTLQAQWGSLEPILSTRSRELHEVLRPVEAEQAPKRSLSATTGLGPQPLHSDGAHLERPPDVVVLAANRPTPVSTLLWRAEPSRLAPVREELEHGLFLVNDGKRQFLAPALARGRLRFDPGCMSPLDSRARRVKLFFEGQPSDATRFDWSAENMVLVINNMTMLHARADASDDPRRELTRLQFHIRRRAEI